MGDRQVLMSLTVLCDTLFGSYLGPVCRCVKAWDSHHGLGLRLVSELAFGSVYMSLIKMCGLRMSAYTLMYVCQLSMCQPVCLCVRAFISMF